MKTSLCLFPLALLITMGGCAPLQTNAPPAAPITAESCAALADMVISPSAIGLPTAGARVSSARLEATVSPYQDAEGEHLLTTPGRCLVLGAIASLDRAAPPIQFAINMPLQNWNGRMLQSGGGGVGGQLITAPGNKASGRFDPNPVNIPYPITQGYVTFGSDNGHGLREFAFARSDEAVRNWAHEELKKTRDTAVAIVAAAYGRRPTKVFFNGESAGGREALRAIQKYPDDYDGAIATSPVISWNASLLADARLRDAMMDGFLDRAAIKLVADRTRSSCDLQDGLKDGVVGKYLECPNDAEALMCRAGQATGTCLTEAQLAAVRALRDPWKLPVPFANGVTTYPGMGVTGDEDGDGWQWSFYPVGQEPPSRELAPGFGFEPRRGGLLNFGAFWVRHIVVGQSDFNPRGVDLRQYRARVLALSEMFDATDPDLSHFAARGGKLIIVHPSADNAAPMGMAAEYYGSVVAKMGQARTDAMLRLYVPAGGSHNVGGTTQVNALAMLEDWVLHGRMPPDAPVAYNLSVKDGSFIASAPACRYPSYPRYIGGDPKQAASFVCTPRTTLQMMQK